MKKLERIPLHDHVDRNSGGPLDRATVARAAGITVSGGGGGSVGGSTGGGSVTNNYVIGPWSNVTDYGATGDGTTDDTAAIQDAIDAVCAIGNYRTIFFPAGTYKITSTLDITCPVRLLGESADADFFDMAVDIQMATANTTAISCTDFEGQIDVESLQISGPGSASSGSGIYTAANVSLRAVAIRDFYDGLHIDDSLGALASSAYYTHVDRAWFTGNARAGIYLKDQVNNVSIRESYFALSQQYGVKVSGGGYGLRIEDCSFELHTIAGIDIDGTGASQSTSAVYIAGCYFEHFNAGGGGSAVADIRIGNSTQVYGVTITGCFMVQSDIATLNHIDLNKVDRATLIGNVVRSGSETSSLKTNASNTTNLVLVNNSFAGSISVPASTLRLDPDAVPGGELGGTWAVPTVDTTHSGSTHAATQAAAEATAAAALAAHVASSGTGSGDHEHMIDVFNGDAATTAFELTDEPLDPEAVYAFVGGSWTAVTVSGAMNTTVTFGAAPGSGTGNVVIQYPAVAA